MSTLTATSNHGFRKWLPLILISSLGLFLELAVIRWLSVEVRLFAYFKNLPLLAAFLGLAIGFALVNKDQDYLKVFAPLLLVFSTLIVVFGRFTATRYLAYPSSEDEHLWYTAPLAYWPALLVFLGIVAVFFMLTMLLFIPLGQATGKEMARHAPVQAYVVNIVASLVGTWVFSLVSFLQTPPVVWFILALGGLMGYCMLRGAPLRRDAVIYAVILVAMFFTGQGVIWSPYQRLSIKEVRVRQPNRWPIDQRGLYPGCAAGVLPIGDQSLR